MYPPLLSLHNKCSDLPRRKRRLMNSADGGKAHDRTTALRPASGYRKCLFLGRRHRPGWMRMGIPSAMLSFSRGADVGDLCTAAPACTSPNASWRATGLDGTTMEPLAGTYAPHPCREALVGEVTAGLVCCSVLLPSLRSRRPPPSPRATNCIPW